MAGEVRRYPETGRAGELLADLLAVESNAARLEGIFLADPEIGQLWRVQLALSEACKSVALEDIHITEGDLVLRGLENREKSDTVMRGSYLASRLLRVLCAPGDLRTDPGPVLQRCLRVGEVESMQRTPPEELIPGFDQLAAQILSAFETAPGPVLAAIRAAAHLRLATGSENPAAERLLFICVDHAWRREMISAPNGEPVTWGEEDLLPEMRGSWILMPSLAMTAQGFRAWSPVSRTGLSNLLFGLRLETGRALGSMPVLLRWRDQARGFAAAAHGKSHLNDLISLFIRHPILTAPRIATMLGVNPRTARNLVKTGVAEGILAPITGRRSYRAWAPTPMAERLRLRSPRSQASRTPSSLPEVMPPRQVPIGRLPEFDGAGEAAALAELDAAMAAIDTVLARYRAPRR